MIAMEKHQPARFMAALAAPESPIPSQSPIGDVLTAYASSQRSAIGTVARNAVNSPHATTRSKAQPVAASRARQAAVQITTNSRPYPETLNAPAHVRELACRAEMTLRMSWVPAAASVRLAAPTATQAPAAAKSVSAMAGEEAISSPLSCTANFSVAACDARPYLQAWVAANRPT